MGLRTVTNVTDSAVQKNKNKTLDIYNVLKKGKTDFRGQEASLVSTPLIPQKAHKRLILNTNVSLGHKAHALDTWIQNPNTQNINFFLPLLYNMTHLIL